MAEPVRWLHFLSRWSLMLALVTLALPIVFFIGLNQQVSDDALGAEYAELLQAVRSPSMYRVAWTLDAVVWLMLGGSLLSMAGILRRHAPIVATFIAACGMAQLIPALGGFIRLNGISDVAAIYPKAALGQQALLLESYVTLWRVINSHYQVGILLQGVGFLLAAWGVYSLRGFPRWLAVWVALPGLLAVIQFILFASGAPFSRPLNILDVIVGNVALNFAMAVALWHPSTMLVSAAAGESAGDERWNGERDKG